MDVHTTAGAEPATMTEKELFAEFLRMELVTFTPQGRICDVFKPEDHLRDEGMEGLLTFADGMADDLASSDDPDDIMENMIFEFGLYLDRLKRVQAHFDLLKLDCAVEPGEEPDKVADPAAHAAWEARCEELEKSPRFRLEKQPLRGAALTAAEMMKRHKAGRAAQ